MCPSSFPCYFKHWKKLTSAPICNGCKRQWHVIFYLNKICCLGDTHVNGTEMKTAFLHFILAVLLVIISCCKMVNSSIFLLLLFRVVNNSVFQFFYLSLRKICTLFSNNRRLPVYIQVNVKWFIQLFVCCSHNSPFVQKLKLSYSTFAL